MVISDSISVVHTQSYAVDFIAKPLSFFIANWQFDWLEICQFMLERQTPDYLWQLQCSSCFYQDIKKATKESIANKYSVVIELKYDTSGVTEKHMFYEHFVAGVRDGYLIAPLTYYANNFIRTFYWKQIFFFTCQKNISWFERQHW